MQPDRLPVRRPGRDRGHDGIGRRNGPEHGVAVLVDPAADGGEAPEDRRRDGAVRSGADVEEQVRALRVGADEAADDLRVGHLLEGVVRVVPPGVVGRGPAALERHVRGDLGLARIHGAGVPAGVVDLPDLEVLALEEVLVAVVADEARRLEAVDVVVEVAEPPVEAGRSVVVPLAVEPDAVHRPVAREELRDLVRHEGEVGVVVVRGGAARIVRSPPVQERIVEAEREALLGAGLRELLERVAAERRRVDDVVVRLRGVEHGEAVVVARRDRDVARAGPLERLRPGAGVEVRRVELGGLRLVVRERHVRLAQVPLALAPDGVDAPVDEDAEAPLRERLAGVDALGGDGRADGAGGEEEEEAGKDSFHGRKGRMHAVARGRCRRARRSRRRRCGRSASAWRPGPGSRGS